jgi:hypothetical protein
MYSFLCSVCKMSDDLGQLAHDQVKSTEYSCYDINGYYFRTTKFGASCPLATTTNIRVVTSVTDASGHITDYYDVL